MGSETATHSSTDMRQVARLSWWMVVLALRSTTDLLDHPDARRA